MTVFKATGISDLLAALVAEQRAQTEGNRNTELFRRVRVAVEHGLDPDEVASAMSEAAVASGLSSQEVRATIRSAMRAERAERIPDGTPPQPSSDWSDTWARTWPRLIGVAGDKRPMQRWQYGWDEPNDAVTEGVYLAIVIPPGIAVLDIDDLAAFTAAGGVLPDAPHYPSISGKPGKAHYWFRIHPDRPYPTRTMKYMPGVDLLVGGMGIANVANEAVVDRLPDPRDLPFLPDWLQPRPSSRVQNIRDYLAGVPEHIPWVIDKVAFVHGLTLIAGQPKAGKSTLSFEAMRCLETGEPFLGQFAHPAPALLVTEEGGVSVKFKGEALTDLDVYDRKASEGEPFAETLKVIADWAGGHAGGVVFIDTLAAWAQVEDENDSAEMQKAIDAIRLAIAEPFDVAVVLIHHARKGGGSYGEGIRGSGAILAAVDHVMELRRSDSKNLANRRSIDIMSRVLHAHEKWMVDWDGDTQRYTVIEDWESEPEPDPDELRGVPSTGPGMTAKAIGLSWRRLNKLVGTGQLRELKGLGTAPNRYWTVVSDEEETDDDDI